MSRKQGYIITTHCLRLRCKHPDWLAKTQDFYNQIQKFYYDLFLEHPELKTENSQVCLREMERLSIKGRDGRGFPEDAQLMSPSVVLDRTFEMLHVPVREVLQDASSAKDRILEGRNICGVHFTNGNAFAVSSVMDCEGKELAVRYFKGGNEYRHRCKKILEKIGKSRNSCGKNGNGKVDQKYWMHLKHLSEHYAHQISVDFIRFCEEQRVGIIAFPKYDEDYRRHVLKGAGNFSPLHLSTRIRECLTYKAWKEGILMLDANAKGMHSI